MKQFILFLIHLLISNFLGPGQDDLLVQNLILKKELEILKRSLRFQKIRTRISNSERRFFTILAHLQRAFLSFCSLFTPEMVLAWFRIHVKGFWTHPAPHKRGRKSIPGSVKNLILEIKLASPLMSPQKISDELKKIGFKVCKTSVANILRELRREGKIPPTLAWSKFLKAHWNSLFACDFFTIDTAFAKRIYVFFILHLSSRRVVQTGFTENPTKEFVRQQVIEFENQGFQKPYLIHDNGPELCAVDYSQFGITGVTTCVRAPNMNAYAERFVRSVRREALDWFLILSRRQARNIVKEYVHYYNTKRPHQGIDGEIPDGLTPMTEGQIRKEPILGGLWHHYYRIAS